MKLEFWSDIVCPFCGLMDHRLHVALDRLPYGDQVQVIHRSFQLHPDLPREGVTQRELIKMAGAPASTEDRVLRPIERAAEAEGLTPYHAVERTLGPTDLAHELLARIGALLRRAPTRPDVSGELQVHEFGRVHVDSRGTEVFRDGVLVNLSAREFQLLRFFLENPGVTLPREELLTRVWGYHASTFTRTVDVHVSSLRQKLEDIPRKPQFFLTVQGLGYKFKP